MRKTLLKFVLALTFVPLIIFAVHSQPNLPEFTVSNTKIYAPDGKEFIIKGANIGIWVDHYPKNHVNHIKNNWKFNAVRLPLRLKPGNQEMYASDDLLDNYVNAYTTDTNGPPTVIILECHDHSGRFYTENSSPSLDTLRDFWRRVAVRYKDNPYVWFNIMNEPGSKNKVEKNWYDMHKLVIQDIRKAGANNVIVVDGYNFGSEDGNGTTKANLIDDSSSAFLTYGQQLLKTDPKRRIVFSLHTYTNWNWSLAKLDNFVERVHNKGLAMIIGEYAATTGNSHGDLDVTEAARITLEVARKRGIGRLVWHYWSWDGNALTTRSWGGSSGDTIDRQGNSRPKNLTWLGEQVWDDAHDLPQPNLGVPLNRFAWKTSSTKGKAAAAIDNNPSTAFYIKNPTAEDWLQLDLGAKQSFNNILMDGRKASTSFLRDYQVYVSDSADATGKLVAEVKDNAMACMRVSFPTQTARYIKIVPQTFAKKSDNTWAIAELFVYSPGTPNPPPQAQNELKRNRWQAKASKRSSWDKEWENRAFDGNTRSRYTSGGNMKTGDWFEIDMGKSQSIRTLAINVGQSGNAYPRRFEVYVGDKPGNFGSPAYQGLGSPVTNVTFDSPQKGRYLRIVNKQDYNDWWAIHDLRAYN